MTDHLEKMNLSRLRPARWTVAAIAAAGVAIIVVGCSSSDSTTPATSAPTPTPVPTVTQGSTLAVTIAAALVDTNSQNSLTFSQTEASCLADRVIAEIGEERLIELGADTETGFTSLDWTEAERTQVFEAMRDCVDIHTQLVAFFESDGSTSHQVAECVATAYEKSDVLPDALMSTGPDSAIESRVDATLRDAFSECS